MPQSRARLPHWVLRPWVGRVVTSPPLPPSQESPHHPAQGPGSSWPEGPPPPLGLHLQMGGGCGLVWQEASQVASQVAAASQSQVGFPLQPLRAGPRAGCWVGVQAGRAWWGWPPALARRRWRAGGVGRAAFCSTADTEELSHLPLQRERWPQPLRRPLFQAPGGKLRFVLCRRSARGWPGWHPSSTVGSPSGQGEWGQFCSATVPGAKSWWPSEAARSHSACPAHQPAGSSTCVGRWRGHPPVQPRAVAAKRGVASVSYKKFTIIILIIIHSASWGCSAARESVWGSRCLRGARTCVGPGLGAVLQVQRLGGRRARPG